MAKYTDLMNEPDKVSHPIPGRENEMVQVHGNGWSFEVGMWTRLDRFLILGSDSNTYYADAQEITKGSVNAILSCAENDYKRTINRIVEVSTNGLSFRRNAEIFAMALIASSFQTKRPEIRQYVFSAIHHVARTASSFMLFQENLKSLGEKWNRSRRVMTANWYNGKNVDHVAYQTLKYRSRSGWTHENLIRLANFGAETGTQRDGLYHYLVYGKRKQDCEVPAMVEQFEEAKAAKTVNEIVDIITKYVLTWEFVPSEWLGEPKVWTALLPMLPYTALLRNISRMTANGALSDSSVRRVANDMLKDEVAIRHSRIHPISILMALATYRQGHGRRGKLKWEPIPMISDSMEDAFYKAFPLVEPSDKRILVGLDVSSSMWGWDVANTGLNAAEAAAAMVLSVIRVEHDYEIMAFSHKLKKVNFGARSSLGEVLASMKKIAFGATDCSLPITWAMNNRKEPFDLIMILTDNEVNRGYHVGNLLKDYRRKFNSDTKFVSASMVSNVYSVADQNDPNQMDIVGFDASMPAIVSGFAKGEI